MITESGEWIMLGREPGDPDAVRTPEALIALVKAEGFLPLFAGELRGFSVEERTVSMDWWSGDPARDPWEWRKILASDGRVAYGKFFGGRAGFVSAAWLPALANYRRDGYDFDARWEDGKAHYREKKIMDLFPGNEEYMSFRLKEAAGFGPGGERNFEGTLTRLQMETYLVMRDFRRRTNRAGRPYGWPVTVYATPESLWGYDHMTSAYGESPAASRERILARLRELYPNTTEESREKAIK